MICQPTNKRWKVFLGISSIFILLAIYTYLSHRQHIINPDDSSMPSWSQIKDGLIKVHTIQSRRDDSPWIVQDSKATSYRFFIGWGSGILIAIVLGVIMGCYRKTEDFLTPPFSLFKQAPPTAMIAVFFILFGTGMAMYSGIIIFGLVPILALSTCIAVKDVPSELTYKSYTLGASDAETICHVIFPTILPKIIDAARLQIGPAIVYLIAAEMMNADVGFGFRLRLQSRLINMNVVYPYIAYLAIFGYSMDLLMIRLQKFLCPWYHKN